MLLKNMISISFKQHIYLYIIIKAPKFTEFLFLCSLFLYQEKFIHKNRLLSFLSTFLLIFFKKRNIFRIICLSCQYLQHNTGTIKEKPQIKTSCCGSSYPCICSIGPDTVYGAGHGTLGRKPIHSCSSFVSCSSI